MSFNILGHLKRELELLISVRTSHLPIFWALWVETTPHGKKTHKKTTIIKQIDMHP